MKRNHFHQRLGSTTTTEPLHHLHPETLLILFVSQSSPPWRRLDKTGAVGGMWPSGGHLSSGWGPPYRPLRSAGDVQGRAAARKRAESC